MPQVKWQFVEDDDDGQMWLAAPTDLFAFVRAIVPSDGRTYSLMVVTQSWLAKQVEALNHDAKHSFFAPMLVIRDGSPADLRRQIDEALSEAALSMFGRSVTESERAT